jgi:photosystem II stability/assembly factor-like uncharacterized protein
MSGKRTILVGTVGQGVFRSTDEGANWLRTGPMFGMHSDAVTRSLTIHPDSPDVVFAGTDQGLYRTDDRGEHWHLLDTPMKGKQVWAMAIDRQDPDHMISGIGTPVKAAPYVTKDGGETWTAGAATVADTCPAVGIPRPTAIAIDPQDSASVWMSIEVDGLRHSGDSGSTWERTADPITNPDVHNVLVTSGPSRRVFVLVNDDVWISEDNGGAWRNVGVCENFPLRYPRGLTARPDDPSVVFVCIGDTTPGQTGAIMRSTDAGASWQSLPLPEQPNSAIWTASIDRENPDRMWAASRHGYLYRSEDGGDSWTKLSREFSEVSSIAILPGD